MFSHLPSDGNLVTQPPAARLTGRRRVRVQPPTPAPRPTIMFSVLIPYRTRGYGMVYMCITYIFRNGSSRYTVGGSTGWSDVILTDLLRCITSRNTARGGPFPTSSRSSPRPTTTSQTVIACPPNWTRRAPCAEKPLGRRQREPLLRFYLFLFFIFFMIIIIIIITVYHITTKLFTITPDEICPGRSSICAA